MFPICLTLSKDLSTRFTSGDRISLPKDYYERVSRKGDTFRDNFTRACLYLASYAAISYSDYIVVASQLGNTEALDEFERECRSPHRTPSAIHFSQATTSAAATSVNIAHSARGGNLTINGGDQTLHVALLAAGLFLDEHHSATAHVFWEHGATSSSGDTVLTYLRVERAVGAELSLAIPGQQRMDIPADGIICETEHQFIEMIVNSVESAPVYLTINGRVEGRYFRRLT